MCLLRWFLFEFFILNHSHKVANTHLVFFLVNFKSINFVSSLIGTSALQKKRIFKLHTLSQF